MAFFGEIASTKDLGSDIRLMKKNTVSAYESTRTSKVDGYTMLAAAIAKYQYRELCDRAFSAYSMILGISNLNPSAVRRRLRLEDDGIDVAKVKRQFNSCAAWFDQGDFSKWFDSDVARHLIYQARWEGLKRAARSKRVADILLRSEKMCIAKDITKEMRDEYRAAALLAEDKYGRTHR